MSFPSTDLEQFTEVLINGVWTDITTPRSVRANPRILISRGIGDETTNRASTGTMDLTLDNRGGTFSDLNPSSPYYGLIGRNTRIRHSRRHAYDAFGRTSSNGWSTADSGQAWSTNGGVAGDYSVGSGVGSISNGSVNVVRETFMPAGVGGTSLLDSTVCATLRPGVVATGAAIQMALTSRRADANNYVFALASFETTGVVNLYLYGRLAGANSQLNPGGDIPLAYGAGSAFRLEFDTTGGLFIARLWDLAAPSTVLTVYGDDTVSQAIAVPTAAGSAGCRSFLVTGNTNTTPVVTFDDLVAQDIRFSGEVPEWPQRWNMRGTDVHVPLQAAGLLRRLQQGTKRLQSVMTRALQADGPLEYWACEDASGATQAANLEPAGAALVSTGAAPSFGTAMVPGTASGFTTGTDTGFRGIVRASTATTLSAEFLINVPSAPASAARMIAFEMAGGTYPLWALTLFPAGGIDTWGVEVWDSSGVRQVVSTANFSVDGVNESYARNLLMVLDMRQNGGNVEFQYTIYDYLLAASLGGTGSYAGTLGHFGQAVVPNPGQIGLGSGTAYSQISLWEKASNFPTWTAANSYNHTLALNGHTGEDPGQRMRRLATENGIDLVFQGDSSTRGIGMGPQNVDTLYNLLLECVDVDQGLLYETRTQLGLTYRASNSLYSQTPVVLDYTGRHLAGDIQPTSDDQYIRNDVTVARKNGSSYRAVQSTGPLNVAHPPAGVGTYDRGSTTVNVQEDVFAPPLIAQCLLARGTVNEPRYPGLGVNLASPALAANTALTQALLGCDTGDLLNVTNPPAWLPPFTIEALVLGYREELGTNTWKLAWTTAPASPYNVIILDSGVGNQNRADCYGQTLNGAHTSSTTTLSIATASPWPTLSTAAGDYPVDIEIAGERITLNNAPAGSSSPQSLTGVTRSVNGVVKAQASGATVQAWRPSVLGF